MEDAPERGHFSFEDSSAYREYSWENLKGWVKVKLGKIDISSLWFSFEQPWAPYEYIYSYEYCE